MNDSITILKSVDGSVLAKQWPTPTDCIPYAKGGLFNAHSAPVASLTELASLLDKLRKTPLACAIRGELRPGHQASAIPRRSKTPPAPFDAAPRRWVLLDIDGRPDPDETFPTHPHVHVDAIRSELPEMFRRAACYWHASGSAGVKPGVRVHIWFWLDRPVSDQEWRTRVKSWSVKVDAGLFSAVQVHYTSDPVLGFADPMAARSGMLPGDPHVVVPVLLNLDATVQQVADKTLNKALHAIRCAPDGTKNNALFFESRKVAQFAPALPHAQRALVDAGESIGFGRTDADEIVRRSFENVPAHPACASDGQWSHGLQLTDKGTFACTPANVLQVAAEHPALRGVFVTDARSQKRVVNSAPPWDPDELSGPYPRTLHDGDGDAACLWLDREARIPGVSQQLAHSAIVNAARKIRIDRFRDWLEALEHDGTPRLDTWLHVATRSVDDPDYLAAVGSKWLISAVARTFVPGEKADAALVLVGAQGTGKSTMIEELAGSEWFQQLQVKLDDKDACLQLQGPVIVELAELASMRGKDVDSVKLYMALKSDNRRLPYGREPVEMPRRCVYAGSTNNEKFLHDTTGGRRFWPVHVGQIDVAWVKANRDQLWAEARARHAAGEQWYLTPAEEALANAMQEDAREVDLLEDALRDYLDTPQGSHTGFDLRLPPDQLDHTGRPVRILPTQAAAALQQRVDVSAGRRLADAFRALGWDQHRSNGKRYYVKGSSETVPF